MNNKNPSVITLFDIIEQYKCECRTTKDLESLVQLMQMQMTVDDYEKRYGQKNVEVINDVNDYRVKFIEGEIAGVEKYLKEWRETGDNMFREIAKDELEHAKMILEKSNLSAEKVSMLKMRIMELEDVLK